MGYLLIRILFNSKDISLTFCLISKTPTIFKISRHKFSLNLAEFCKINKFVFLKQNGLFSKILLFTNNLFETIEKDNVVSGPWLVLSNDYLKSVRS